jgi:type II secretory pathway component PulJ
LVSLVIFSLVMAAVISVVVTLQRGFIRSRDASRGEDAVRAAETAIVAALRNAGANPRGITGTNLPRIIPDPDANGRFDDLRVLSDFNPADGDVADLLEDVTFRILADSLQVRWRTSGSFGTVAFPVRALLFEYQRVNKTAITSATDIGAAVAVRVTITAPRTPQGTSLLQRQVWVYLRNAN